MQNHLGTGGHKARDKERSVELYTYLELTVHQEFRVYGWLTNTAFMLITVNEHPEESAC